MAEQQTKQVYQALLARSKNGKLGVAEPPKESGPHAPIIVLTDLG